MIENLGYISPGTETVGGRRTVLSDSSGKMRRRYARRKGLGLRRYKSSENLQSDFPEIDRSSKRKRTENGRLLLLEKEESNSSVISLSSPASNEAPASTKAEIVIPAGRSGDMDDSITAAIEIRKDAVRCWSHGSISVVGRRRENEDAVAVELGCLKRGSKGYDFFGVYDGHGGSRVAHDCRDRLHIVLREILEKEKIDEINWNGVMMESFEKIDEEVNGIGAAVATMGSTAVVAVVGEEELVVANCGDSRAVLSRGGVAVPLSIDHKPDRCDELERIEQCGGKVINWNGQRVLGVLATSRSIGDQYLKPYVISDPEVIVTKRSSRDEFLILASDGLWDVVSNEVACHIVRRCLSGQIKRGGVMNGKRTYHREETGKADNDDNNNNNNITAQTPAEAVAAAALLAELAMARGSKDNISVIVVVLRK